MAVPDYLCGDVLLFDTETAVLGDYVVEIGLSLFRNAELVYEWSSMVKPPIPIDPACSEIHKIYDKDVENSPSFGDIAFMIINHLQAADVISAYNYEYDRDVLGKEFTRIGVNWPNKPMLDPLIFYRLWHKYSKGKTLIKAAEKYGIQYVGAHRACNDATVAGKILFKMAATRTDFPKNLRAALSKQRHLVQEQFEDLQAYFIKIGKGKIDTPEYKYYDF